MTWEIAAVIITAIIGIIVAIIKFIPEPKDPKQSQIQTRSNGYLEMVKELADVKAELKSLKASHHELKDNVVKLTDRVLNMLELINK